MLYSGNNWRHLRNLQVETILLCAGADMSLRRLYLFSVEAPCAWNYLPPYVAYLLQSSPQGASLQSGNIGMV